MAQCILTALIILSPFFVGSLLRRGSVVEAWLFGQVFLWAVFQLLAVPMVWFRLPFRALCASYALVLAGLTGCGVWRLVRTDTGLFASRPERPFLHFLPLAIAICVIAFQVVIYAAGMHLDEDDSRFIVEANDAIAKNTMYLHNPANGEYIGRFVGEMKKDIFSPWAMYLATLSVLTMLRPAVFAHSVYAPVLLLLSYAAYYLIGRRLFRGVAERGIFLLMVSVMNMFFTGDGGTQSAFSLIRIWQGKAVVAAVMIPFFMLLLLELQEQDRPEPWLWLCAAGCGSCLLSGMGTAFSAILIAVFGGYAALRGRFRRLPLLLLALLPSAVFGLLYFWWR